MQESLIRPRKRRVIPKAIRVPGAAPLPMWLWVFLLQVVFLAPLVVLILMSGPYAATSSWPPEAASPTTTAVPSPTTTSTTTITTTAVTSIATTTKVSEKAELWGYPGEKGHNPPQQMFLHPAVFASWIFASCVATALFVHVACSRRISFLSAVVQQDPRVVAGDPVAFNLLADLPFGCRFFPFLRAQEVDTLQISLAGMYTAYFLHGAAGSSNSSFAGDPFFVDDMVPHRAGVEYYSNVAAKQRRLRGSAVSHDAFSGGNRPGSSPGGVQLGAPGDHRAYGGMDDDQQSFQTANDGWSGDDDGEDGVGGGYQSVGMPSGLASPMAVSALRGSSAGTRGSTSMLGRPSSIMSGPHSGRWGPFSNLATGMQRALLGAAATTRADDAFEANYGALQGLTPDRSPGAMGGAHAHSPEDSPMALVTLREVPREAQQRDAVAELVATIRREAAQLWADGPTAQRAVPFMTFDPLGDNAAGQRLTWDELMRGVPDPGGPLFAQLLKQVRPGQGLSAVALPVHILEPRSLLERLGDLFVHSNLIRDAAAYVPPAGMSEGDAALERLALVVKWFISPYHLLPDGCRKPYNPLHGEVFAAQYTSTAETFATVAKSVAGEAALTPEAAAAAAASATGSSNETNGGPLIVTYLAEQVSHHPPVTVIKASAPGVFSYRAVYHPASKLVSLNCAASVGEGNAVIELNCPGRVTRRYSLTWPSAYVSGFLMGQMKLELGEVVQVQDLDTKCRAEVDFMRKGWLSGEYDQMRVRFFDGAGKLAPFAVEGCWHAELSRVSRGGGGASGSGSRQPFLDARTLPAQRPVVCDVEAVAPGAVPANSVALTRQSRAVWARLTEALRAKDTQRAMACKVEVEQAQRQWRKQLAARSETHQPLFFKWSSPATGGRAATDPHGPAMWEVSNWATTAPCDAWFSQATNRTQRLAAMD